MENKLVFEPIDAGFVLHNGIVKLRLLRVNGAYTQEYCARTAEGWRLICAAERSTERIDDASMFRDLVIGRERDGEQAAQFTDVQVAREHPTKITLKLTAQIEQHHIALYITLEAGKNHFHCLIEDDIHEKSLVEYLSAPLIYLPGGATVPANDLDIIWVPHQRPLDEHVIGDHSFRSPAVILQKENDLAIMVPDVEILSRNRVFRTAVDFEVHGRLLPTPTFAYGFKDWVPDRHVYFSHMLGEGVPIPSDGGFRSSTSRSYLLENTCLRFGYYLYLSAQAEPMTGRRTALNFLWETFARPYMESQWPQVIPFEDYIRYMFGWANRHEDTIWQKLTLNGETCGAALRVVTTKGERVNFPAVSWLVQRLAWDVFAQYSLGLEYSLCVRLPLLRYQVEHAAFSRKSQSGQKIRAGCASKKGPFPDGLCSRRESALEFVLSSRLRHRAVGIQ
ncbi:MAG: hypothetical protein IPK17_34805 [Chloroflexi bacterium]|uniref:hypothetical protein n=1 Tax=Candidatus Flexifilum breve TaxID=3140694 RepID=UPI00313630E4|nr:hypothetical protein [Chloroflexota bacterium]